MGKTCRFIWILNGSRGPCLATRVVWRQFVTGHEVLEHEHEHYIITRLAKKLKHKSDPAPAPRIWYERDGP